MGRKRSEVIKELRDEGFSEDQIKKIIKRCCNNGECDNECIKKAKKGMDLGDGGGGGGIYSNILDNTPTP